MPVCWTSACAPVFARLWSSILQWSMDLSLACTFAPSENGCKCQQSAPEPQDSLNITKLDVLTGLKQIRVAIAYRRFSRQCVFDAVPVFMSLSQEQTNDRSTVAIWILSVAPG